MKYIDEYQNKELVLDISEKIKWISKKSIRLMEVCGGHTMAIQKFGIPSLLPENIELLSGPGCPVCVTSKKFIDHAIALARMNDVIITTFGDLIRVPGSTSSLEKEKARGRDVRIVYSSLDALDIARNIPDKKIVFLGIGFETTAPTTAASIKSANSENMENFYVLSSHKIIPPAMSALIDEGVKINGYICPGHVSAITGSVIYNEIVNKYGLSCVIAGFEPVDILQSILMLVKQIESNEPKVEIEYKRAVSYNGNEKAKSIMNEVFTISDDWWRGFGIIKKSGLSISDNFKKYDAGNIKVNIEETVEDKGCICGDILKGLKTPYECKLFKNKCNPANPVGACMVSSEGACQAHYRYASYE